MFPDHASLPSGGQGGTSSGNGGGGNGGGANTGGSKGGGANTSGGNSSGGNHSAGFAGVAAMGGAGVGSAGFPGAGGAAEAGGGVGGSPEAGGAAGAQTVHSGGQGGGGCSAPVVLELVATADAHLSEAKNEQRTNFGDATRLLLSGVVDARARALVDFDLSALPSGHYIAGATLRLVVAAAVTGERTLSAYRVGRLWQEDKATWVRAQTAPTTNWTVPGGDTALVVSDTRTVVDPSPGTAIDFQVAADLGGVVPGSNTGFGWLLDVAASEGIVELSSRESLFAEERPELVLELCPSGDAP